MNRNTALNHLRKELDDNNLRDWKCRLSTDINQPWLGICMHNDKVIMLNAHHIDIHPDAEIIDTIKHEVAHAIVGVGNGHNEVWAEKAREIGCTNTLPCSHLNLPEHVIDAIRSGQQIEMEVEERVITNVIRTPKYTVTRLQEKCPICSKVAEEVFSFEMTNKAGNPCKIITLKCGHVLTKVLPKATPFDSIVTNDWKPEVKNCKHSWNKNQCNICNEYKLYPFQVDGARAAEQSLAIQKGFLIADDMGLGKTWQGLAVMRFHPELHPFLVVTKSKIKFNWFKETIRILGLDFFPQIINSSTQAILPGFKAYIISYDLLRRLDEGKLEKLGLKAVILDEVQQIKNVDSARTQEVRKLVKDPNIKVLELSGTPWKNRGSEFFPALNLISPMKFPSYASFVRYWVEQVWDGNKFKQGGIRNIPKFKEYTKDLIIRREFDEVVEDFPSVNRTKLQIKLEDFDQVAYDDAVSEFVAWYNQYIIDGTEESINSLELLGRMQKMRHLTGLAKIEATLSFVEEFLEDTDRKLCIFVHHKDVAQILHNKISEIGKEYDVPVFQLVVEQGDELNNQIADKFTAAPRAVMIASTLGFGEGLNFQTCSDAIMHERQWNPQNEDQAAPGRFKRIGQKAKVINITFPHAEGTMDDHIDGVVDSKRKYFHAVHNKGEIPAWNEGELVREVAQSIVARHKERQKRKSA